MRRIVHSKYGFSIGLEENVINEIIIENPCILSELIQELNNQCEGQEGSFILSEEDKLLSIEKSIVFIKEPFSIDMNQRKILGKLYSELEGQITDSLFQERTYFNQAYICYMDKVCEKSNFLLTYEEEPECQEVFKLAKLKIESQTESLLEAIVEYIKISVELLRQQIFVFLNLKLFLTSAEIVALYQECFCRKVQLILLEAVYGEKLPEEKICIIDRDMCIIYI